MIAIKSDSASRDAPACRAHTWLRGESDRCSTRALVNFQTLLTHANCSLLKLLAGFACTLVYIELIVTK
ncbi:hypothetical protein PC129_g10535 [Phytophthora cactorum]|uniref:Uncharacterized protein n=1 Tax=Phytophthora cactorum TaxID=29920 RepID=A0A8T0ZLH9_9STRA|nr:hypothetical protein PC111_g10860 [Phytophthora cactorum]KAG2835167.1 hypothetical protein PC112_g5776 [Phytophthora cactorum]KAG2863407.1 hypothetical protein PC113_g5452 [Phytophthora cactorum]KAG2901460.1 hypothetical protein PC114_g13143 [Phytophthora cactorum]KAG2915367.1 hypothetical protein PC115_g11389 [Phytophthora cactorum]